MPGRCIGGSTSAPRSRPARCSPACRTWASTWSTRGSATARAASPATRRSGSHKSATRAASPWSSAGPGCTYARWRKGCSTSRPSTRRGASGCVPGRRTWRRRGSPTGRRDSTAGSRAAGGSGPGGPSRSHSSRGGDSAGGRSTRARPGRCGRGTFNSRCPGRRCSVASPSGWTRWSAADWGGRDDGSGAVATELGLELARRGHEVHFVSYASPFRLRGYTERVTFHEVTQAEYPLFEQSSPYALALAVKQHEVAMRENLDLMHVHYAIPHAATAWLAKQMLKSQRDLKIVTTLHGTDITLVGQDPSYYTLTKFSIEQSDRVTAVSAFLREETYRAFGCAGCDVIVIPNFISTAEYHPPEGGTCRRSLAPPDHKVLVHVSNFRPVKRMTDVVRVFAGVRRELPATLVLVGDGPERDAAQQEVDRLELGRDVRFLGKVDNVAEILRGSDLFLLPSETESFGLAALEAMACAVPVLASAVGGLPEVVVHGETGFLTPKGDVEAMIADGLRG